MVNIDSSLFDIDLPEDLDIKFPKDVLLDQDTAKMLNVVEAKKKAKIVERHKETLFMRDLQINTDKLKPQMIKLICNSKTQLTLPEKNSQIRIRTQQSINQIGMIIKIIEECKKIKVLTIATYTLNKPAWAVLQDLLATGRISTLELLLASSYSFRDKEFYSQIKELAPQLARKYDFKLAFAWSHFKITLAHAMDNFYVIEGSMNYSANNMAEQVLFEENQKQYEFDHKFITEIVTASNHAAVEIVV